MKLHSVTQGTDAWHQLRDKHFSASEAAAVMGDHKYMTRADRDWETRPVQIQ